MRGGAATPITDPVGKVRTGLAVSLDGFIGGPNDGAEAPMGDGGGRETAKPPGRWMSTLEAGRVSPRPPRVVVDHAVVESDAKTPKGRRSLALDPVTLAALKAHQVRQAEEKTIVGPGYQDSGLVCTMPDGSPIHPQRISAWFVQHTRAAGLPPWARSRSRWTPTATSSRAWTSRPPRRSPA